jgi:NAD(P)-dependent dehydrogenase (short-subunit alcohol dehydrogenase family)
MKQKTVIITGGSSGLGYQCARNIAMQDVNYNIVIASRGKEHAENAVSLIKKESGNLNISYLPLNLASQESIHSFIKEFNKLNLPPLYGLVCNAADNGQQYTTQEGYEITFGTNHLGHFLLVNLLLPYMDVNGRIVFVSSDMHNPPKIFGPMVYTGALDLAYPKENKGMLRYALSKLCNIYCTYELSRRMEIEFNKQVSVNAFNPGMMPDTGGFSNKANPFVLFTGKIVMPGFAYLMGRLGSSKKSGKALAEMITDVKYEGMTGKYIDRNIEKKTSALSYNLENAKELWETSKKLVGLK